MFGRLFRSRRQGVGNPASLYGAIVAQARSPQLYSGVGVPDTVEGRFEMVVLHLFLVLRRLRGAGEAFEATGQEAFDLFCQDMDRSLREMGVGDLSVPKRMRKIGESFYGRSEAYEAGLAAADPGALRDAISRNVWPDGAPKGSATALAAYARASAERLKTTGADAVAGGKPVFAEPADFAWQEAVP
jgi:cytochrome b pre-mRNA-processing protein 3